MNKINIIKLILGLITLIFFIYFQINDLSFGIFIFLLPLLTYYMYQYKERIPKYKSLYNIILLLLMFFSAFIVLYIFIILFQFLKDLSNYDLMLLLSIFNLYLIVKIFIDMLININKSSDKINDLMIIIVFSIINLIFIIYYF